MCRSSSPCRTRWSWSPPLGGLRSWMDSSFGFRACGIDGVALQRDRARLKSCGPGRNGGRGDLRGRKRGSGSRRDEALFHQRPPCPRGPARLATPVGGHPGSPRVRGSLPLPASGPHRFRADQGSGADEIFLLHRSGVLLKHFSPDRDRVMDSDILGGMLAAVRMFIEDSMNPSAGALQEIRFSGGSIVFVTGQNAALAALNARGNRARFANRAMGLLREFENLNGDALSNFDGLAGRLDGVDALFTRIAS